MLVFDFSVTEVKKAAKTKENLPTLPHQLIPYDSSADPPQKLLRNDNLMKNKPYRTLNPFTSKTDQHEISPHNISPESNIDVTRKTKMITKQRGSSFLNKFSLSTNV